MLRTCVRLAAAMLLAGLPMRAANAQVAISALPAASVLAGTEVAPVVQTGTTKQATVSAIAGVLLGQANTWTATQTVSGRAVATVLEATSYAKTDGLTVSTLPAAATAGAGARSFVTDATACTFGSTLTGGGSTKCPVYSDGAAWRAG